MAALVDTNILVYRFDPRFAKKQRIATELLRRGIASDSVRVPHQAILEFVAVTTRPLAGKKSLLEPAEARREAEELLLQFTVCTRTTRWCGRRYEAWLPISSPGAMRTSGPTPSTTV